MPPGGRSEGPSASRAPEAKEAAEEEKEDEEEVVGWSDGGDGKGRPLGPAEEAVGFPSMVLGLTVWTV